MAGHKKAPDVASIQGKIHKPGGRSSTGRHNNYDCFSDKSQDALVITHWTDVHGYNKKEVTQTWPEFCTWLKSVPAKADKKKCPLIKLASFGDVPTPVYYKDGKKKGGSLRHDGNVLQTHGIEGDIDSGLLTLEAAKTMLEAANVRAVITTTHSHTDEHPRLRILCPLSEPSTPDQRKHMVARMNGILGGHLASESFNLSQSWFIGGRPDGEYQVAYTFDDPDDGYFIDQMPELDSIADYGKANATDNTSPDVGQLNEDLRAAQEAGLEPEHLGGGKWALICPWKDQHTKETVKSSCTYMEPNTNGYMGAGFRCLHDHCASRKIEDLRKFLGISQISKQTKTLVSLAYKGQRGCAELFAELYHGQLAYDHTDTAWYEFSGHCWTLEKKGNRLQQATDKIQEMFQEAERDLDGEIILLGQKLKSATDSNDEEKIKQSVETAQKQQSTLNKLIHNLNTLAYRKQVVEFAAQGEGSLGIAGDEWDLLPWMLPCTNGVLDLSTGQLREGRPEDFLRATCPCSYYPDAKAPRWEQALQEIFAGDKELISFVQRVLGMSIVGAAIEHKLIVLWGAGRNGKDTILEALAHVLGSSLAGAVQSELLLDQGRMKSSAGPSADIMRLRGLRLAWASETNEGRRLDAGKIKLLTGGGHLVGRAPYARYEISFPQSHTLFLLTNSKPHAPADDYALWKRLVLIPFTQSFVEDPKHPHEHKADQSLPDKLKKETEGILAWLVQGCLEWQLIGLHPPDIVQQAVQDYRKEEDILLQFVEDACFQSPDAMAPAQDLYDHYREWMTKNGLRPMSGQKFGRKMGKRFSKDTNRNGTFYKDIGILKEFF